MIINLVGKRLKTEIKLQSMDGSCQKNHIKHLGVMIDESLSQKYHISYICHYFKTKTLSTVPRRMFFVTTSAPNTESALLLDILTVDNVYHLNALEFTHMWHKGFLPKVFENQFQYAKSRLTCNTRYALKQNFCKPCIRNQHWETNVFL